MPATMLGYNLSAETDTALQVLDGEERADPKIGDGVGEVAKVVSFVSLILISYQFLRAIC